MHDGDDMMLCTVGAWVHRKAKGDGIRKEKKATEIAHHHMDREIDVHSYLLATLPGVCYLFILYIFLLSVYDILTHGHVSMLFGILFFSFFRVCAIMHSGP